MMMDEVWPELGEELTWRYNELGVPYAIALEDRDCCTHPGTGLCMCDCHDWELSHE